MCRYYRATRSRRQNEVADRWREKLLDRGPNDRHELALYLDVGGLGVDRRHRHVRRLQTHSFALVVEALERGLPLVLQPDRDRVAVFTRLLLAQDDDVAIVDERINHRVSLDPQRKEPIRASAEHVGSQFD